MCKFPPRSCGDSRIRFVTPPEMGKVELSHHQSIFLRLVLFEKATHPDSGPRKHHTGENGRIVAACGDQYEAMPDRVLKPQVLPHMKDDACRVKDAACREKPKAQARESRCNRLIKGRTTPTEEQVENNGQAIEATGQ